MEGPGHNVEAGRRMGEGVSFRGFGVAHFRLHPKHALNSLNRIDDTPPPRGEVGPGQVGLFES